MFSDVWSENAALFERLMEIHSNPPILYNGFNCAFFDQANLAVQEGKLNIASTELSNAQAQPG